jgi:hypothetical protein
VAAIGDIPGGGIRGSGFLRDRAASKFYGYKFTVEPVGNGLLHVEFQPFDEATLHRDGPFKRRGASYRRPHCRDPFVTAIPSDVDLYTDGTDRVLDQVSTRPLPKEPAPPEDPLRLTLDQVRVFENDVLAGQDDHSMSGVCVWIHLPDEGRYLIALNPLGNPQFVPAGYVNGTLMEFNSNNKQFRVETASPIARAGDHPIYVFRQQWF